MSRQKTHKHQKKLAKDRTNRSKMEPKWNSGARFVAFLETLFSYNTTVVLRVFSGFGWSRGDQKSIKKRVGKTNLKKQPFLAKNAENCWNWGGTFGVFGLVFRSFCALGAQWYPKGAWGPPRDSQCAQMGTKKEPKRHQNGAQGDRTCVITARKVIKKLSEIIDCVMRKRRDRR